VPFPPRYRLAAPCTYLNSKQERLSAITPSLTPSTAAPISSKTKAEIFEVDGVNMYICPVIGCDEYFKDRKKLSNHCTETYGSGHSTGLKELEGFVKKSRASVCKDSRDRIGALTTDQNEIAFEDGSARTDLRSDTKCEEMVFQCFVTK
jgi:uncharacterized C2H2 Zn-finger protein